MGVALGDYELLKRLGAGGMGEVFLARPLRRESRSDDRFLVIKTLLPHLSDDEGVLTMFLDEARLAARLNHGNVCQIYELGEADGTWFIAMEYVSGRDCAKLLKAAHLRGERFPPSIACRIVSDAAAGLHYSHDLTDGDGNLLGLVHRDVSPANIVVTYEGGVKLIDFGVAKAAGRVHQTQAGQIKGKISYMSPEQAKGKAVDKRSDIFSLGIVLHELLTCRKLYDSEGQMEVLWAVCEADVQPPSVVDPSLPADLDKVVMKALTLSVDDRYATALEFRNALERWIVTSGSPPTPQEVGAVVTRLCEEEVKMEQESGPLWDADIDVSAITSILDPMAVAEGQRQPGPLAAPPPSADDPNVSTAVYSSFDEPEHTSVGDLDRTEEEAKAGFPADQAEGVDEDGPTLMARRPKELDKYVSGGGEVADSTMDAAPGGAAAYEATAGDDPSPTPVDPAPAGSDREDGLVTSITENPLAPSSQPDPSSPPFPSPAAVSGSSPAPSSPPAPPSPPPRAPRTASGDGLSAPAVEDAIATPSVAETRPLLPVRAPKIPSEVSGPTSATNGGAAIKSSGRRIPLMVGAVVGLLGLIGAAVVFMPAGPDPKVEAEVEVQKAVGTPIPPPPAQRVALTIVTDPPGADAVLDGRPIGKTPILGLPIPPVRKAKLVLQREGSVTLKETLSLTKDLEVTYQLVPEKVTVRVVSRPAGAKVTKRGKALGVTPFDWVAPAGVTAKLKFSKRGYRSVEQAVTAEEGVEVSAVLKKSRSGGGRRGPRPFRPSSSIDPRNPPKPGPSIPTFGD